MTANARCRPGDLAMILRDELGRMIEVHGPSRQTRRLPIHRLVGAYATGVEHA